MVSDDLPTFNRRQGLPLVVERLDLISAIERRPRRLSLLQPRRMRHTFIWLLLAIGENVPYVMRQVGHVDPKVTLSICPGDVSAARESGSA